jgi:peptidoglycan/LPS O-acetylase OafA/YrhL
MTVILDDSVYLLNLGATALWKQWGVRQAVAAFRDAEAELFGGMIASARLDPLPALPHGDARSLGLDLLRALAILLVMISHYGNNVGYWFHYRPPQRFFFAGDLGVELFFALSGFLIGLLLIRLAEHQPTARGFGIFMVRRWMRTLPLYFLWLGVLFWLWPPRHDATADALHFLTLTQNLFRPMPPDFFFAVSWSLTIEEWFYLLFGGALILATRLLRRPGAALALVLAVFLLGPLILRLVALDYSEVGAGRMKQVFFRIDEIAYGVAMAWLYTRRAWPFRRPWPLLLLGLLLIGLTWAGRLPLPVRLLPALTYNATIAGCALCLPAALRLRRAPAWFAVPVRLVSALSYALYLVHLTILVDFAQGQLWGAGRLSAPAAAVVAVLLPFVIATLSYRYFEGPILRRRPRQEEAASAAALVPGPA